MLPPEGLLAALREAGIDYFTGVPDSLLKSFCQCVAQQLPSENHVIAANEGTAVGLAIGYHLATGAVPLVYLQNSGLGNTVNPLVSLADPEVYSIPMLLMVGWRGEPGVTDEPQHKKQGRVTLALLEALEVPYTVIDGSESDVNAMVAQATQSARQTGGPHALVVRAGSFEPLLPAVSGTEFGWQREDAINSVVRALRDDDVVVATTGMASRELFELRERAEQGHASDFLTVGGMGHASQIALGLSLHKPGRRIVCLDGDGAALMHMGAMATSGVMGRNNFYHVLINNGVHDSVGGQPTVAMQADLVAVASACGYLYAARCGSATAADAAVSALLANRGPAMLELRVDPGHREGLTRPTTTPLENKRALMEFLNDS